MRRSLPTLALALCLGCGDEPVLGPLESGDPGADSGEGATCRSGFDGPLEAWSLPASGGPWRNLTDATCSGETDELHRFEDMNGDRRPDLVRYADCGRSSSLGHTHWQVHLNTGTGFEVEGIPWSLPDVGEAYAFSKVLDNACEADPDHLYELADLTGDEQPDLVVLSDCRDDTPVGSDRWAVYENTGSGFADTPIEWAAPAALAPDGWRHLSQDWCDRRARDLFRLADLDGDRAPELVRFAGCVDDGGVTTTGSWSVYRNTGAGFASTAEEWMLPTDHGGDGWPGLYGTRCEQEQDHLYRLMDLTGDGVADLVQTSDCTMDPAWDASWRVYPGTTDGWGAAAAWRLPPNRAPGSLHSVESTDCVYPTDRVKRMVDVTDDDRLDLLVLGACRDGSVPGAWEVFPNEGDGFAPDPVHWWLPADNESVPWAEMADERCNTTEDALMSVLDLNGDTLPDVVHTYGCDPDAEVGAVRWEVRFGVCTPGS